MIRTGKSPFSSQVIGNSGRRMSRSQNGACSKNCPFALLTYRGGGPMWLPLVVSISSTRPNGVFSMLGPPSVGLPSGPFFRSSQMIV